MIEHTINSDSDRTLYLDTTHKKIGGVCAGVANYFNTERRYVRIAAVVALLLAPTAAVAGYGLAFFILEEQLEETVDIDETS